jgi:hypothetical protein
MHTLSGLWHSIQRSLFPFLEEEFDPLTEMQMKLVAVLELMDPRPFLVGRGWCGNGRPPKDRVDLFRAFVAKAVYNFTTTEALLEQLRTSKNLRRLCGWENSYDVPSPSTFSRVFAEFAESGVLAAIHAEMIRTYYGDKLAGHVNRDSTAIKARERAVKKVKPPPEEKPKRKGGRLRKGEKPKPKEPTRIELQPGRSLEENLRDLPTACDIGAKKNSKGHKECWIGYKLHADVVDGGIPISVILTSASTHDSQVAIPLAQMTQERVTNLYDLMDKAYDAAGIWKASAGMEHVPIIDRIARRKDAPPMAPAERSRFGERTTIERVFSMLKDNQGGKHVRVKGAKKVMAHLMFGMLVVTATQLFRLLPYATL